MSAAALIGVLLLEFAGGFRGQGDFTVGVAVARADLADQHYKRAVIFYENKDYPRAIREFQAAYKVRQLPRILLNIGQVYRKLGMASTALKFYEHYLRVDPQPKPEIKGEVDRYIAQTRAMLDPPDIVPLPSKSAAAAAAEAVAAAPSDVTPVTVPEYYADSEPPVVQVGPGGKGIPGGKGLGKGRGQPLPGVVDRQAPNLNLPGWQTRALSGAPATAGNAVLGSPLVTPLAPPKPFYKKGWFWGVVGGVAAGVVITGVAVGVTQKSSVPGTILYPTK
jgi:hypothetical protein